MAETTTQSGVIDRIRRTAPYLNPALKRIATQILEEPDVVKSISIKDLAIKCEVSESTVTRFVREIEVPSFQQLKISLAEELSEAKVNATPIVPNKNVYEDITKDDTTQSILEKVSARYTATVDDTRAGMNIAEVERAVKAIEAAEILAFYALGSSVIPVENALLRFMRVGKSCQFFRDLGIRQFSTETLGPNALAIGVSNSGRTISTVEALKSAKSRGAQTMCITSFPASPITEHADISIFTSTMSGVTGSGDYRESMVSKIAQLQVIDILYSIFAVRNFGHAIETLRKTDVVTETTRY